MRAGKRPNRIAAVPGKGDLRGVQGREREAMGIRSILAGTAERAGEPGAAEPDHFRDLNLDQVVSAVAQAAGLPEVAAYFHRPLRDADLVAFRQEVFRDLEDPAVRRAAERFTASMTKTRTRLEALARRKHPPQVHRLFLEIVLNRIAAVDALADDLGAADAASSGLRALRDDVTAYVDAAYVDAASWRGLREDALRLRDRLAEVRYDLLIREDRISMAPHDADGRFDFAERVRAVFERFRQGPPPERRVEEAPVPALDAVEAGVLDLVAELFPDLFGDLAAFCASRRDFVSAEITRLDRELRFYLGYLAYLEPVREAGLPVCYPAVSATDKRLLARDVYDLAPAAEGGRVVTDDLRLTAPDASSTSPGPTRAKRHRPQRDLQFDDSERRARAQRGAAGLDRPAGRAVPVGDLRRRAVPAEPRGGEHGRDRGRRRRLDPHVQGGPAARRRTRPRARPRRAALPDLRPDRRTGAPMRPGLLSADGGAGTRAAVDAEELLADLRLDGLWAAMARGDETRYHAARAVTLAPLTDPADIVHRQRVLGDCLRNPSAVRSLHRPAAEAVADDRKAFRGGATSLLNRSARVRAGGRGPPGADRLGGRRRVRDALVRSGPPHARGRRGRPGVPHHRAGRRGRAHVPDRPRYALPHRPRPGPVRPRVRRRPVLRGGRPSLTPRRGRAPSRGWCRPRRAAC